MSPSTDLITRARAGDGDAFRALTEPHRRELHAHCYRMLGSVQDAEDALQDTLLAAWRGLAGFEGRASMRTWLYRIATNRCLNALRAAAPAAGEGVGHPRRRSRRSRPGWARSSGSSRIPDALLDGAPAVPLGPGGPLRAGRVDLAGVRDRAAAPAAAPARGPGPARRPRVPGGRGRRHAGHDRRARSTAP